MRGAGSPSRRGRSRRCIDDGCWPPSGWRSATSPTIGSRRRSTRSGMPNRSSPSEERTRSWRTTGLAPPPPRLSHRRNAWLASSRRVTSGSPDVGAPERLGRVASGDQTPERWGPLRRRSGSSRVGVGGRSAWVSASAPKVEGKGGQADQHQADEADRRPSGRDRPARAESVRRRTGRGRGRRGRC